MGRAALLVTELRDIVLGFGLSIRGIQHCSQYNQRAWVFMRIFSKVYAKHEANNRLVVAVDAAASNHDHLALLLERSTATLKE